MSEILVKHSVKKRIKEELNTSYPTVQSALFGMTDTQLAREIREKALQLGGVEVKSEK
ncbi:hypothetical protein [Dysgonomonas macrotermitis]|uniref:Uncharacterized protein n=1 Tax=Dysgonomonas macrotermitis TaxID=1346286 RepID=A0A1M4SDS6_9BACT|nr:hypothetical protein [Dysgonomonas macrotermitis]SHE30383.1 hypothetical protein SAMN05444362_10134 [Dysgonomonas macrotermitis]